MAICPGAESESSITIFIRQGILPTPSSALCSSWCASLTYCLPDAGNTDKPGELRPPIEIDNSPLVQAQASLRMLPLHENTHNSPGAPSSSSASGSQDTSSCETVVRPDQQHSPLSLSWAQELYENGIIFGHTPGDSQCDEETEWPSALAQPTATTDGQERRITFASPPEVPLGRATSPVNPDDNLLPLGCSKEPGFRKARPPAEPREGQCRDAEAASLGTMDRNKETRSELGGKQYSRRTSWICNRFLLSKSPEECPIKKRLSRDQFTLVEVALSVNHLHKADAPALLPETTTTKQTPQNVGEGKLSTAESTTKSIRGLEIAHVLKRTNRQLNTTLPSFPNDDPALKILNSATIAPNRGLLQDQIQRSVLTKLKDTGVAGAALESALQRKKSTVRQQKHMEQMLEKDRVMCGGVVAENEKSVNGPACTRTTTTTTTTTGFSHNVVQVDGTNKKGEKAQNRHVHEALERLRKNSSWSGKRSSRIQPTPNSSLNSKSLQEVAQERGTTSTRVVELNTTKNEHMIRNPNQVLTDHYSVPTFTSTSADQASSTTAAADRVVKAAWSVEPHSLLRKVAVEEAARQPGSRGAGGDERGIEVSGGLRERVVAMVAQLMVLSVKGLRLYWWYLSSCLNPWSDLSARMHGGELKAVESAGVIVTVMATFYVLYGLYIVPVCFRDALQGIWEDEMYHY